MAPTPRPTRPLRVLTLTLLLLASSVTLLATSPGAAAANGDLIVAPGNPCGAQGTGSGVAVDEVAKRLYYVVREKSKIHNVSSVTLTGCSTVFPAANPTWGWSALAFTRTHATIRFWAANNATVYGLSWSGATVASHTFAENVDQLEVDEANGDLILSFASDNVLRRYSPSFALLGTLATTAPNGVSSWQGGFLVSEWDFDVRLVDPSGTYAQFGFRPGWNYQDEFFQWHRFAYDHYETAFDETTYAGRGALYLTTTSTQTICISNCPTFGCIEWENGTCIRWGCLTNCTGTPVYQSTKFPYLRAVEVFRPCPTGPVYQPCGEVEDPCEDVPTPAVAFARPTPGTYVRGDQVSTWGPIVVVDGPITVELADPSGHAQKQLDLTWPGGGSATAVGQPLVVTIDTTGWARGMHTIVGTVRDVESCRIVANAIRIFVEDPVLATRAQNLRIEGNIPAHVVAGTLAISPADALLGHETYHVLDRDLGAGLGHASALTAEAQHVATPNAVWAHASTQTSMADGFVDLQQLCFDLTADPSCSALPPTYAAAREQTLVSSATVYAELVGGYASGWGGADGAVADARTIADRQRAGAFTHATPQGDVDAYADAASTPLWHSVPGSGLGPFAIGPMTVTFNELQARGGPLHAEMVSSAIRIEIDDGTLRGEIVIGESYAGVSLGGAALLAGAPALPSDDFATGADAAATPAAGPTLAPGLYSGAFEADDREDAFRVAMTPGEKLRVVVSQAHQAGAFASPVPTAPNLVAAPRLARVTLMDPAGVVRDVSTIAVADAQPGVVELNVDLPGEWGILIERMDARDERAPYALAVERAPVAMPPEEGAGATCASAIPLPPTGAVAGALDATDGADVLSFVRTNARALAITLTPLDADGADLDVTLLNASCVEVAFATELGPAKGAPETIALPSLPTGTWYVKVERVNGIGGYALTVG